MEMNQQEKKDLDKYLRFLCYKSVQVIIQSRQGEKFTTKSNATPSGSDWFNICLGDKYWQEVSSEAKRAMAGQLPSMESPLCVELLLRHVDGSTMPLEVWSMGVSNTVDLAARPNYTVYNKMAVLIKSLLTLSRITPAYRLSRRQGADQYVILYQVYNGEPRLKNLGEGYMSARVGEVGTPIGTVSVRMSYRVDLTFSPLPTQLPLKDDHFNDAQSSNQNDGAKRESPKLWTRKARTQLFPNHNLKPQKSLEELLESKPVGAFADTKDTSEAEYLIPDSKFIDIPEEQKETDKAEENGEEEEEEEGLEKLEESDDSSSSSVPEDFVLVELVSKTPFGGGDMGSDLGSFYRSWQSAPPLTSFSGPPLEEQLDATKLKEQIDCFQTTHKEFEKLLTTMCHDEEEEEEEQP